MGVSKPTLQAPLLHAVCGSTIGFFVPWYFLLPADFLRQNSILVMLIAFFVPGILAGGITWFRQRSHELVIDGEREIWYRVNGVVVWGGRWDSMTPKRRGLRLYVMDSAGRSILWEQLRFRFSLSRKMAKRLPSLPEVEQVSVRGSGLFVWSLAAFVIGMTSALLTAPAVRHRFEGEAFAVDFSFVAMVIAVCLAAVLLFGGMFGMLIGLQGILPEKAVRALNSSSAGSHCEDEPVTMRPGVRYAYRDPEERLKNSPGPAVMWFAFGLFSAIFGGLGVAAILEGAPIGVSVAMFAIGALGLGSGAFGACSLARFRLGAFDEFEIKSTGELVVHRRGESRTLKKVGEATAANKTVAWGQWYEKYRDHRGPYRLDTRYLIEKRR
jgi:hypothetical protein